jgi:diaminopimelate decarboxylase
MNLLNFSWTEAAAEGRAVFIYDLPELKRRSLKVCELMQASSPGAQVSFSVKANPHPDVLRTLGHTMHGFDVSSELELALCRRLGIAGNRISLSGPGKTDECLRLAKDMGLAVVQIDSLDELAVAQKIGLNRLSFRIHTPDIFSTKLGLGDEDLAMALSQLKVPALGLHLYMGREAFQWERLREAKRQMHHWFTSYPQHFVNTPRYYIGPGMPASWPLEGAHGTRSEISASPEPVSYEIGRGIVADCGFYAVPVLARKRLDRGGEVLIVHGGLQHLGSPFVSFGQKVSDMRARVVRDGKYLYAGATHKSDEQEFLIAGSLCLAHDILHPRLELPRSVNRGDWIIFPRAGAYGLSAGVPFFIGQDLPKEVIFDGATFADATLSTFRLYHESF